MSHPSLHQWPAPVLGLAGYSGSGKTTLLCQVLPKLTERGVRVAVVKHSHHDIELDKPGKDSYNIRHSGASQMLLASPNQVALFLPQPDSDDLAAQLRLLDWPSIDCVLVEGYRHSDIAKVEVHRPVLNKPLLYQTDDNILAVASDAPLDECPCPNWPLNDIQTISDKIFNVLFPEQ